ncbi:MAG: CHAD domain-containing protein [Saprospiraceae bacterium]|nr:CHAD domain-containing protein [Saprospiraceae bacterium]
MDPLLKKLILESGNWLRTLKSVQKNPDSENIHLFRLAIKQLNTFSIVIQFPGKKDAHAKTFAFLNKCFQTAGIIRNAELQLHRLSANSEICLINLIQKNERVHEKAKMKFIQLLESSNSSDLVKFQIAFSHEIEKLTSRQFLLKLNKTFQKNLKKLNKKTHQKSLRRNLHDMRIIIRRIIEIMNFIGFFEKDKAFIEFNEWLKTLNKKIGNWHDAESLHLSLLRYLKKNMPFNNACYEIADQLEIEMAFLEQEIENLLTNGL